MTARYLAALALMRVETGAYSNLVLDAELKKNLLTPDDRAFASAVFYSTLEHQKTLDYILNQFLKKPADRLDAPVRAVLRSGLAQIRYLRTPPSAAVNEAVKLTRVFKKSSASGMVNAVLRRAGEFDLSTAQFTDDAERLMVLGSVSRAVAEHFLKYYPEDAEAVLTASPHANAFTAIRANTLRITPEKLAEFLSEEGVKTSIDITVPGCLMAQFHGSPAETKAFQSGLFHVEGRPSQLAALSLQAKPGDKAVDLCAAPGGKSLTIAQEMQDKGTLFSCDVSPNRVSLIEKTMRRASIQCAHIMQNDASVFNRELADADCILADVPCSGLGILQKKPDIRYKGLEQMSKLTALQCKILENAAKSLQKGGRLVYSTCTLNPEENENQIRRFLEEHTEFSVCMPEMLPDTMRKGPYGALSLPNETGMDGFFICAMEKN